MGVLLPPLLLMKTTRMMQDLVALTSHTGLRQGREEGAVWRRPLGTCQKEGSALSSLRLIDRLAKTEWNHTRGGERAFSNSSKLQGVQSLPHLLFPPHQQLSLGKKRCEG